jgi:hypothetical protein
MEQEDKDQDVLAIWQTCVEMANGVSQRRDTMNNLFVTLNIAVIAAVSWMWDVKTVFLCVAGLVICVVWLLYINNFKRLNAAKFRVIYDLEERLGVTPFKDEWDILKKTKRYLEGTKLERILPIAFALGYAVVFVILICTK